MNPADAPVLTLALTSDTLPLPQVEDLAETRLAQKISELPGVGLVGISGGQRPAVRIRANPTALAAYGLTLEDVRAAVAAANVNQAKGAFDGPQQARVIDANDQLLSSRDYRPLIVAYRNGGPVHLSDVAQVLDDAENVKQAAWRNDVPAVILNIQRQPGANVIEVVDRVKGLLPQLVGALPSAVQVSVLTDRTTTIRASVRDVQFELMLAVALVVLVIFLFLRSAAATAIPGVAVPLSLIGTFGVMYLLGFSLNNLSLMALTISTGFVVDDAIVMIENIARYIEEGQPPLEAALRGAEQIGFTIISLTVSLIAVLIPLLFMSDVVGRLFREFAITLGVTIVISALVSLTLTPMMCARLLRHTPETRQGRMYRVTQRMWDRAVAGYGSTLRWVLDHQGATLLVAVGTLIATVLLYVVVPKGFFPVQDTGVILGISEAPQSISFAAMAERQQALARVILRDPAVASLSSFIGVDGTNTTLNSGRIQINLKPLGERRTSASDVIRRLQPALGAVDGITLYMQPVQDLTVDARVSRTQYQYTLDDPDRDELARLAPRFVDALRARPELSDVGSDQQDRGLQTSLAIDRSTASRLGITPQAIDDTLYDAFGQRQVSTIFTQLNQYRVVLEVEPAFQRNPGGLQSLYLRSSNGGQVPFSAVTALRETEAPLVIGHQGQFPATTLSFNLAPGVALGEAVRAVDAASQAVRLPAERARQLPGDGAGLPGVAGERAVAHPGGAGHGLHRARRPLRELHPPPHDPLHAAVRGDRRAAGASPLPHRLQRHRAHRDHPADRDREEERDHDDRLRAGRRARGRKAAPGGHLRGVAPPLPADHDDDDGGPPRRPAAGAGHGGRVGAAAPARDRDRRRARREPGPHALHHARRVPRLRSPRPPDRARPRGSRAASGGGFEIGP